jgi:hypothetical protein
MKYITFTVDNGDKYGIPLELIARERAEFYLEGNAKEYEEELKYIMNDSYEGIDWYLNNQNPDDFYESDFVLLKKYEKSFFGLMKTGKDFKIEDIKS